MPVRSAGNVRLLIDEFNFAGSTTGFTFAAPTLVLEANNLESTANENVPGNPGTATLSLNGYYTGKGAGYIEQELHGALASQSNIAAVQLGAATGGIAWVMDNAGATDFAVDAPVDGLITLSATLTATDGARRGRVVYDGAISATGTTTPVDTGATGSDGGLVYVQVRSITGTATDATIVVQHATTSGGSYSTKATVQFDDVGMSSATMTGTVARWLRINTTALGGADAFTVTVIAIVTGVTG